MHYKPQKQFIFTIRFCLVHNIGILLRFGTLVSQNSRNWKKKLPEFEHVLLKNQATYVQFEVMNR